jgi:hypothetical protein
MWVRCTTHEWECLIPNMHALILLYVIYFKIDLRKYLIEILSKTFF